MTESPINIDEAMEDRMDALEKRVEFVAKLLLMAMPITAKQTEAGKALIEEILHGDLAHHLEQEHERNNRDREFLEAVCEKQIALEVRIEELEKRFSSNAHPHPVGDLPLPKGENN